MLSRVDLPQPDGPEQGHELLGGRGETHPVERAHPLPARDRRRSDRRRRRRRASQPAAPLTTAGPAMPAGGSAGSSPSPSWAARPRSRSTRGALKPAQPTAQPAPHLRRQWPSAPALSATYAQRAVRPSASSRPTTPASSTAGWAARCALDLARRDPLAADLQHVVGATREVEVAVGVAPEPCPRWRATRRAWPAACAPGASSSRARWTVP